MATSELRIRVLGEDRASGPLGGVLRSIQGIATVAGGMLTAGLFQALGRQVAAMGREALQATADYELLAMSLQSLAARELRNTDTTLTMGEAMALSADRAEELLNWTTQLALKSPFDQAGVAEAFRTALAYGFTTDQAQRLTRATIDMATATGASTQQMNQIALALGQVQAKGRLQGQEILQLVNAGIPALQMLANYYGITTAEAQKMVEQGLVPANEAFEAIVGTLEDDFAGAAERSSESWAGLMNAFEDLKAMGLRALFEGILEALQPVVAAFAEWLQGPGLELLADWGRKIGEFAEDVITLARYLGEAAVNGELVDKWLEELPGWLQPAAREIGEFLAQAQPLIDFLLTWAGLKTPAAPPSEMPGWEGFEPEMQQALMDQWEAGQPPASLEEALALVIPQNVIDSWNFMITAIETLGLVLDENGDGIIDYFVGFQEPAEGTAGAGFSLASAFDFLGRAALGLADALLWWKEKSIAASDAVKEGWGKFIADITADWNQGTAELQGYWDSIQQGLQDLADFVATAGAPFDAFFAAVVKSATWWYNLLVGNSIIPDTITEMMEWFGKLSDIQQIVDEVAGFFPGLKSDILSVFAGFSLYDAGANLMQGLKNGIVSKALEVANAVRNAVRNAIGAGNDEAGNQSPSKVFAEMGKNLMLGLERGVAQNAGAPASAVRAAIGGAAGVNLPVGAGRGGVTLHQEYHVHGVTDPDQFVRLVSRQMARDLKPLLGGIG